MMTPSGRFEINKPICTSFSDYHPETWDPSWNIQTIVLGLISFMLTEEVTAGAVKTSDGVKRNFAAGSLEFNFRRKEQFTGLFGAQFEQVGIDPKTCKAIPVEEKKEAASEEEKKEEKGSKDAVELFNEKLYEGPYE